MFLAWAAALVGCVWGSIYLVMHDHPVFALFVLLLASCLEVKRGGDCE